MIDSGGSEPWIWGAIGFAFVTMGGGFLFIMGQIAAVWKRLTDKGDDDARERVEDGRRYATKGDIEALKQDILKSQDERERRMMAEIENMILAGPGPNTHRGRDQKARNER